MTEADFEIMRALIAKDWRLLRVPVIGLLIASAGAYLLAYLLLRGHVLRGNPRTVLTSATIAGAFFAGALTSLLASIFGGVVIAGERSERSCDFLSLLPVTRKQIVLGKLIVSAGILCACAAIHGSIDLLFDTTTQCYGWKGVRFDAAIWFGWTISFFGVAWLFSTLTPSGPISASASIAVTVVCAALVADETYQPGRREWELQIAAALFSVGIVSMVAGVLYYLRRIAP